MRTFHRLSGLLVSLATLALLLWLVPQGEARPSAVPPALASSPHPPPFFYPEPLYFELGRRMDDGAHSLTGLSILGPHGCTGHGDPFSSLSSPWEPGLYTYQFAIFIPPDYETTAGTSHLRVELLDPDSINANTANGTIIHTQPWINAGDGRPSTQATSCTNGQQNTCVRPTNELQTNCSLSQQNDPNIFCAEDVDLINPYWFFRMDENRGSGPPPGNSGFCGQPSSYSVGHNTLTRYELAYYQAGPEGSLIRTDLASYTGQAGDSARDYDGATSHQTDLQWVAPGSGNDLQIEVPTDCGSMTGGYNPSWNPLRCPILLGHEDGRHLTAAGNGFEIDLSQDVLNMAVGEDGWRYLQFDITTISGASENGFGLWAGPPSASVGIPANVNLRNVYLADNPNVRSAAGVRVLAANYLPMQAYMTNYIEIPLAQVPASAAGEDITISLFDTDSGTQTPLIFSLNTISITQFSLTFGITNPEPEGRCFTVGSNCQNEWVGPPGNTSPPYTITLPLTLTDSILMAEYLAGGGDTYVWGGSREKPDLAIGGLEMVSPWPAEPNSPLTFTVAITNTSGAAVPVSITLDLFINPTEIYSTHIPLAQSSGQTAIASLGAGETQVITLTAPLGFGDNQVDNTVCAMVDSVRMIFETAETNNIACRLIEPPPPILVATPPCTNSALYQGLLQGEYWGTNAPLMIYWNGVLFAQTNASPNGTLAFNFAGTDAQPSNTLSVVEDDVTVSVIISRPCPPQPDLVIGELELLTPLVANQPLTFTVWITNTGTLTASEPFSVALFINPSAVYTTHIPLEQSAASAAVASLGTGTSQLITLTLPLGLTEVPTSTLVYAMVESGRTTAENNETNNLTSRTFTTTPPIPPRRLYLPLVVR
ncbi:MAG: hypothetical protein OT477_01170 [Chloroflexi bacterium]|nr:hypothetical protein [Chloroflexota bacterium]